MTNNPNTSNRDRTKADPKGAYIATVGAVIFAIATFLAWIQADDKSFSGYEADTIIPFTAYLGLGFAAALVYAAKRATRRQHRGLSLSSMAAGIAATGLALSYLLEVPGAAERKGSFDTEVGVYVALVGALIWTVGSYLLATEPEGDIEHTDHDRDRNDTHGNPGPSTGV
jgi:hypothetical protein